MRNGQNNKRMRGRNRKGQNPMSRVFESNGPDVKIRGTPSHIAEKYIQLARDAQTSGDPVSAENYYQHAEHYYRLIAAAQEQLRQTNPQFYRGDNDGGRDDSFDGDGDDDDMGQPNMSDAPFGTREPQPYVPREAQPFPREQNQSYAPRPQQQPQPPVEGADMDRLPSFITGGGGQPSPQPQQGQPGFQQNGHDNQGGDRFPLHRRRRRHRGPRPDLPGGAQGDGGDESAPRGE